MEAEHADAIVLRRHPVTETSLIVTWYSRQHGKLKTIAKGARRPKGPFLGRIDLFYENEIVFLRSRRSDLHILQECHVSQYHPGLRRHPDTLTAASYACELVELGTEPEDVHPEIFDLLQATLAELEQATSPITLLWFEMHLLAVLGWKPKWTSQTAATKVLSSLAATSLPASRRIRLTSAQLAETRAALWSITNQHLGIIPRSRRLLPVG